MSSKRYYTYLLKCKLNGLLYYGVKYGKNSDPNQLFNPNHKNPYYSSSRIVWDLIRKHGIDIFEYEIRYVSKCRLMVQRVEQAVHRFLFKYHRDKIMNQAYGSVIDYKKGDRIWITNKKTSKLIYRSEEIPEGWNIGYTHRRWVDHVKVVKSNKRDTVPVKENSRLYYNPIEGTLFSSHIHIGESLPYLFGRRLRGVPSKFKLRCYTGKKNITWDIRLPIPSEWTIGYFVSETQRKSMSNNGRSLDRTTLPPVSEETKEKQRKSHWMKQPDYIETRTGIPRDNLTKEKVSYKKHGTFFVIRTTTNTFITSNLSKVKLDYNLVGNLKDWVDKGPIPPPKNNMIHSKKTAGKTFPTNWVISTSDITLSDFIEQYSAIIS